MLWVILLISSILIFGNPMTTFGANNIYKSPDADDSITISFPVIQKIVVDLEKGKNYEKQVGLLEQANTQLLTQTSIYIQQNNVLKEQLKLKQEELDISIAQSENIEKVWKEKLEVCENDKPGFFKQLSTMGGIAGIGFIAGAIVVSLL